MQLMEKITTLPSLPIYITRQFEGHREEEVIRKYNRKFTSSQAGWSLNLTTRTVISCDVVTTEKPNSHHKNNKKAIHNNHDHDFNSTSDFLLSYVDLVWLVP